MKKILAVILARGGSKSIKKKNIVNLEGHPLIAYTIHHAIKSKYIDKVVVSSDDDEIRSIAVQYGAEAFFKRPKHLAKDTSKSIDCIYDAVKRSEDKYNTKYDYVIELMCTNPLKSLIDINKVIKKQIKTNADSVISVMQLYDHHPIRIKKIVNEKIVDFCLKEKLESRRQDLKPKAYIRNGSIYCMRRDMVEKKIRYGTKNSIAYIMPSERAINIDEPRDLIVAKVMMRAKKKLKLKKVKTYKQAMKEISKK